MGMTKMRNARRGARKPALLLLAVLLSAFLAGCAATGQRARGIDEPPSAAVSEASLKAGKAHLQAGRELDALAVFDRVIAKNPRNVEAYMGRGMANYRLERLDRAAFDFSRAAELAREYPMAHYNLGVVLLARERFVDAEDRFSKALSIDPSMAMAYSNRGLARYRQEDYDGALEDFGRAISVSTTPPAEAFYNRGVIYEDRDLLAQALADYDTALSIDPLLRRALNNRAIVNLRLGRYPLAEEDFTRALALKPDDARVLFNRGIAWENLNEYDKAIEDYTAAIALEPGFAHAFYNRGVLYMRLNVRENACEDLKMACNLGLCLRYETARDLGMCW